MPDDTLIELIKLQFQSTQEKIKDFKDDVLKEFDNHRQTHEDLEKRTKLIETAITTMTMGHSGSNGDGALEKRNGVLKYLGVWSSIPDHFKVSIIVGFGYAVIRLIDRIN